MVYLIIGFQLCKYGYNSLQRLKEAVDRTMEAKIPMDIQYAVCRKSYSYFYLSSEINTLRNILELLRDGFKFPDPKK